MEVSSYKTAMAYAIKLLAHRSYASGNLRQKLLRRGHDKEIVDAILAELGQKKYIDDYSFAKRWVEAKFPQAAVGQSYLRSRLHAKGVPVDVIESVLNETDSFERELLSAQEIAKKKWQQEQNRTDDPQIRLRRLAGLLQRRGFNFSIIAQILENYREGVTADEVPDCR